MMCLLCSVGEVVSANKVPQKDKSLAGQIDILQAANSELYKFALKHILKNDDDHNEL